MIGSQPIVILVDSGSTHNFLDPQLARQLNLNICEEPQFQVKIANGEKLLNKWKCEASVVKVQGNKFSISFHLLLLGGCEMVLGVQ